MNTNDDDGSCGMNENGAGFIGGEHVLKCTVVGPFSAEFLGKNGNLKVATGNKTRNKGNVDADVADIFMRGYYFSLFLFGRKKSRELTELCALLRLPFLKSLLFHAESKSYY